MRVNFMLHSSDLFFFGFKTMGNCIPILRFLSPEYDAQCRCKELVENEQALLRTKVQEHNIYTKDDRYWCMWPHPKSRPLQEWVQEHFDENYHSEMFYEEAWKKREWKGHDGVIRQFSEAHTAQVKIYSGARTVTYIKSSDELLISYQIWMDSNGSRWFYHLSRNLSMETGKWTSEQRRYSSKRDLGLSIVPSPKKTSSSRCAEQPRLFGEWTTPATRHESERLLSSWVISHDDDSKSTSKPYAASIHNSSVTHWLSEAVAQQLVKDFHAGKLGACVKPELAKY